MLRFLFQTTIAGNVYSSGSQYRNSQDIFRGKGRYFSFFFAKVLYRMSNCKAKQKLLVYNLTVFTYPGMLTKSFIRLVSKTLTSLYHYYDLTKHRNEGLPERSAGCYLSLFLCNVSPSPPYFVSTGCICRIDRAYIP